MSSRSAQSSGWIWSAEHGDYYRTTIEADGEVRNADFVLY